MITISEQPTKKMPGFTSLFIQFNYNQQIVDIMKSLSSAMWHKDIMAWETPLSNLSELLDKLCEFDEIALNILPDKKEKSDKVFELQKYKTTPFEYQLEGIQYGLNHKQWLLLDSPGLGKSLQIIYIAQELKQRENLSHCLIVCGVNSLKTNWKNEIYKHSDLSAMILGERISKKGNYSIGGIKERLDDLKHHIKEYFVITNIETLRNPDIVKEINSGKVNDFDMIVVDEIHTTKDITSLQGKGMLKLNKAKYKIGATGTLLLNDPCDCFVPLKWIGAENSTMTNFSNYYYVYGGPFHNEVIGYKNIKYLKDQLSQISLRRTKDILGLPPKTVINEYVDMEDTQTRFYNNIKQGIIEEVDKVNLNPGCVLGMVTRLRQATACPSILTTESIPSAKIERACEIAKQLCDAGEKVVIFSTFKMSAYQVCEKLKKYNPLLNTGDQTDVEIETNKQLFQTDDEHKVFVATWQKCGTGITLTRATTAVFLDTPWTAAVFLQAQDRIHRIGTDKPVFIYNLITSNTIDERVRQIVEDKELIGEYIIDDKISPKLADRLKELITDLE